MFWVIQGLQVLVGLASLACFVMVLIKMFQNGQTGLGIACILLLFCGVGALIVFIYGWVKSAEWGLRQTMLAWTGCIVLAIILTIAGLAVAPVVPQRF